MPSEPQRIEVPFAEARDQIERELDAGTAGEVREVPRFEFERGSVTFSFSPPALDAGRIFHALAVVKSQLEHVRVHTLEPGFAVFQSLGENLYDTSGFVTGTKFRFDSLRGTHQVEVSRRGNFSQGEIQACIRLYKLFCGETAKPDPGARLAALGIRVLGAEEGRGDQVGGYRRVRLEILENVILPLRRPELFLDVARQTRGQAVSDVLPRAVLFDGPPGVGKTTMARMIAREARIPLVVVPIEGVLSKYYGESAQNLAMVFDAAAEFEHVIVFLDEIDALAGSREGGMFEATRRVLSVLLRKIEGLESKPGVLTIGATNRSQDLDHALLSRFDRVIRFPLPDRLERSEIFGLYAQHLDQAVRDRLGAATEGASGRAIRDLCEHAERRWVRTLFDKNEPASPPPPRIYLELAGIRDAGPPS